MIQKPLNRFKDIHSHRLSYRDDTVVNLDYYEDVPDKGFYSIGIHPWHTDCLESDLQEIIETLRKKASKDNVVAIGECGLDKLKGAGFDIQKNIFEEQVKISEELSKPLIIHSVKSYNEIIELKKSLKPVQPWIIHGFRGKPQIARQLLNNGFFISVGEHFNPKSVSIVPENMLFFETDESTYSIEDIYKNIKTIY